MNLGTLFVVVIIVLAFVLAIRAIVRSGGNSCSSCPSRGSCHSCSSDRSADCFSCKVAQKMIEAADESLNDNR